MSREKLLAEEEKFARLSVLEKSLRFTESKRSSLPIVRNAYVWLHQKLNSYLLSPDNGPRGLDPQLITEYLTLRLTSSTSSRSAYRGHDLPGFQLLLQFAASSIQPEESGEYVSEEFVAFQQLVLELIRCNQLAPYTYFMKYGRRPHDLNAIKSNSRKFSPIYQFGEICQEWFSLPDLASGILKMIEINSADFSLKYIEDTLQLLALELLDPRKKDELETRTREKIEEAKFCSTLLVLNSLAGTTNLFEIEFHKQEYILFEASIKDKAKDEFGFK